MFEAVNKCHDTTMPEKQDCLSRRYQALDDLIVELTAALSNRNSGVVSNSSADDICLKLMCEFWKILKNEPRCNLTQAICQRMGLNTKCKAIKSQNLACFMARKNIINKDKKTESEGANKKSCNKDEEKQTCCNSKSISESKSKVDDTFPLGQVLCNLKEAVSFEQKCNTRISELMAAQAYLQEQIKELEGREKEGIQMLKQADCMWSCMEEAYKKKVAQSLERQKILVTQMKEIENSNTKWRKNKRDLEFQLGNVNKCYKEIKDKLQEKESENKCVKLENENFINRIETLKKEIAAAETSLDDKKHANEVKVASLAAEVDKLEQIVYDEDNTKKAKEIDGSTFIKDAREDLQKIYRLLLNKKIENEDLIAEKEALLLERELSLKSCEQCNDICTNKEKTLIDEIAKVDAEIAGFEVKCVRCHDGTDTDDVKKFCIDCPKCVAERECIDENYRCYADVTMDCICMTIKEKFIDNVFENMYNVLKKQADSPSGKAVADAILNCLKKSRNGKLNEETRKTLQNFILSTTKKYLNMTLVGGAVKTRCEMDPETYQQLMSCLKHVEVPSPVKEDKSTIPRKAPCSQWKMSSECNCPNGPTGCICSKKYGTIGTENEEMMCPEKDSTPCGTPALCKTPSAVGTDACASRSPHGGEKRCTFGKNMRAAQCILGPDSLIVSGNSEDTPSRLSFVKVENAIVSTCGISAATPCPSLKERKCNPRERIIEEVMGRYTDVAPIEKTEEQIETTFLKFVIKDTKHVIVIPPAILKITDSHNYIIVVDKEYEKEFKSIIKKQIDTNLKYPLKLSKTISGTAIIELKEKTEHRKMWNAYLVSSLSGELKVYTGESQNRTSTVKINCESQNSCCNDSSNALLEVIHSLITPTNAFTRGSGLINKKSSSDSNLYPKCKFKTEQMLLTETTGIVKKSPSGQYTIALNKESKQKFIDNLHKFLSCTSNGFITIKQTENRDVIIQSNNETKLINRTLKISSSGNIYIVMDENKLKEYFTNNAKECKNMTYSKRNVTHKNNTTTCNALPDNSCEVSLCVCTEFNQNKNTLFKDKIKNMKRSKSCLKNSNSINKKDKVNNIPHRELPHIIIRPNPCCPRSMNATVRDINQQVFYVTESVCPFHNETNSSIYNDQSEIPGQCDKKETRMKNGIENRNTKNKLKHTCLDYLDILPPQLPPFLNNLIC